MSEENRKDPVAHMMGIISNAGYENFHGGQVWESALCALILALEPKCRVHRLLEAMPYGVKSFNYMDTLNCLANLGYYARSFTAPMESIDGRLTPCLLIMESGEPLVLLEDRVDALLLYRGGQVCEITKESMRGSRGNIWVFEKYDEQKSSTSLFMRDGTGFSWFRAFIGRFKGIFWQIFICGLVLNVIALATPLYIMLVYDRVIAAGSMSTLPMLTVGVGIAIIFEWFFRQMRSRSLSWLASRMDNLVSNQIFSHLINLPPELIERASVAAQVARLKTFESVRDFFSGSVFLSMMELPFIVIASLAIYAIAGQLVFVPLAMAGLFCLLYYVVRRRVKVVIRLAAKATSVRQQFALETFDKIRAIRGYGLVEKWHERFRDLSGKEMVAHFHLNWLGMFAENMANALTVLAAVATIGFGVHMIWADMMSTGALVATMILTWRILNPFYSLCTMIPRLEQIRHSIMQVNKLMEINVEAATEGARARLPRIRGSVSFINAELRYGEDGNHVFGDLDFHAKSGDMIAITGENGAGKTSVLKLIKGLYRPYAGAVQIDGFDIRQLDMADLRRQIAYVPQQADFFCGSILENLRLCNPVADKGQIEEALRRADCWADVAALPHKMDTIISRYDVATLPSSLFSRLSLARLYLHDSSIILVDEIPNSLLGGETGKNLKEYLAQIKGKRTVFMVTYRDDFIRMADIVLNMRRGKRPETMEQVKAARSSENGKQEAA
jgi:ABC-type bacteriocin/lantibiotic exporter with double-glycine peptidase domain